MEIKVLTDDREANSQMLNEVCDQMHNGSMVAFGRGYYTPNRLFFFVCDVNNKYPDLIDFDTVFNHAIRYVEWVDEPFKDGMRKLMAQLGEEFNQAD